MSTRLLRRAGLTLAVLAASLAIAVPVSAAPPNNGTVKIDGFDWDNLPNNEPHVGCTFEIDFYGFEEDKLPGTVTFTAQEPSGTDNVPYSAVTQFFKNDDNSGGGSEAGLDLSIRYTLQIPATLTAHPKQGYHIKLTVSAGTGRDRIVKHKVFWVTDCDPCEYPPTEPPNQTET